MNILEQAIQRIFALLFNSWNYRRLLLLAVVMYAMLTIWAFQQHFRTPSMANGKMTSAQKRRKKGQLGFGIMESIERFVNHVGLTGGLMFLLILGSIIQYRHIIELVLNRIGLGFLVDFLRWIAKASGRFKTDEDDLSDLPELVMDEEIEEQCSTPPYLHSRASPRRPSTVRHRKQQGRSKATATVEPTPEANQRDGGIRESFLLPCEIVPPFLPPKGWKVYQPGIGMVTIAQAEKTRQAVAVEEPLTALSSSSSFSSLAALHAEEAKAALQVENGEAATQIENGEAATQAEGAKGKQSTTKEDSDTETL